MGMQETRRLVGSRADLVEHLSAMRDGLQADARKMTGKANAANRERLHGRAEGVELALRELAVWTQTPDDTPGQQHAQDRPGPHGTD